MFNAFISYSHTADNGLAPAIQSSLQNFAKPWYKLRTLKIFRDDTNLAISPALWPSILEALKTSEYFILLASPEAALSKWVKKEIEYWINNRSLEHLLIIQTEGSIYYDETKNDFDWEKTTGLPSILSNCFKAEPFYLDLSWAKIPGTQLSLRQSQFRKAILKLASTLLQRDMAELDSEEIRQFKKNKRYAWSAILLLFALTVASAFLAIQFNYQKNKAEKELLIGTSQKLAAQSESVKNDQLDLSLLLSASAYKIYPTFESKSAMLDALSSQPQINRIFATRTGFDLGPHFYPDGKHFLAVNSDGSLSIVSTEDGKLITINCPIKKDNKMLTASALSPDGQLLAVAAETEIYIWDLIKNMQFGKTIKRHHDNVFTLKFSPDSHLLATAADNKVYLWNVTDTLKSVDSISGFKSEINDVAFSRNGNLIAIAERSISEFTSKGQKDIVEHKAGIVEIFIVETKRRYRMLHTGDGDESNVTCVSFNPVTNEIAAGNDEGKITVWNVKTGLIKQHFESPAGKFAFAKDGKTLACIAGKLQWGYRDQDIYLWDISTDKPIGKTIHTGNSAIYNIASNNRTNLMAILTLDKKIMVWDLSKRNPLVDTFPGKSEGHLLLAVSPDGQTVASNDGYHSIIFWNIQNLQQTGRRLVEDKGIIKAIAFSDDSKKFIAVTDDGYFLLWPLTKNSKEPVQIKISDEALSTVAFADSTNSVLIGDVDGNIRMLDVHGQAKVNKIFKAHDSRVEAIKVSPGHDYLVSSGSDDSIKIWKLPGLTKINAVRAEQQWVKLLCLSPDEKTLVCGGQDGSIKFLEMPTLNLKSLVPTKEHLPITGLVFYPDGKTMVIGGMDHSIIFWDIERMEPMGYPLYPHRNYVSAVDITKDGTVITAGGVDIILRWNTKPLNWEKMAEKIANRALSIQERKKYLLK
jgi:WD40 repeat protein